MVIKEDLEVDEELLIDKCVFGDPLIKKSTEACRELAKKCYINLYNSSLKEREEVRRQIIDDVSFINVEDKLSPKRSIESGEEYHEVYSVPNMFDEGFEEKEYMKARMEDKKFGVCHMALYGLEKQFWSQVRDSFFQTKENSNALQDVEAIILDEGAGVEDRAIFGRGEIDLAWEIFKDTEDYDWVLRENITTRGIPINESLSDYNGVQQYKIQQLLIKKGYLKPKRYIPVAKASPEALQKKFEICNLVTNPKVRQNEYKICSEAGLNNKQAFYIKKRIPPEQPTLKQYAEALGKMSVGDLKSIPDFLKAIEYNTKLLKGYRDGLRGLNHDSIEYTYSLNKIEDLEEANKELKEGIEQLKLSKWEVGSKLSCWHSFLAYVQYPSIIKDRWLEVLLAYENKDITREQYEQAVEDIKEMEEMFRVQLKEGIAEHGFSKPTTYQPLRLRLYASQKSVNDLINKFLRFNPLNEDTVPNTPTRHTISRAFSPLDLYQLRLNKILSKVEIEEKLQEISKITFDDIKERLEPAIQESEVEYNLDNWGEMFDPQIADYKEEFDTISEILFGDDPSYWDEYIDVYAPVGQTTYRKNLKRDQKAIIVRHGQFEWYREDSTDDVVDSYEWILKEGFPTIPLPLITKRIEEIAKKENISHWNWSGNQDFISYIPLNTFIERVQLGLRDLVDDIEERYHEADTERYKERVLLEFERVNETIEEANYILEKEGYDDWFFKSEDYIGKYFLDKIKALEDEE